MFPAHPLELFVAFTFVTFAFVGMGLVIATLADNVPAVQALGQCIFLPMLIIGGVAVPLGAYIRKGDDLRFENSAIKWERTDSPKADQRLSYELGTNSDGKPCAVNLHTV